MSARQLLLFGVLAAGLVAAALYWSRREQPLEGEAGALIFPRLSAQQERIDRIDIVGAGNAALVSLRKNHGQWQVLERRGWPADAGKISQTVFTLAQAHLQEARTADPALYPKIGVEALSTPMAQGVELRLVGADQTMRLLIGHPHVGFDGDYVRVNDGKTSWLSDRRVDVSRDPVEWLNRHLLDLPLARIEQVQVDAAHDPDFTLVRRNDTFGLANLPAAAMGGSHGGDAMAGFLDQLNFDDVADDDGKTPPEREVRFLGVDGVQITVFAWRVNGKVWARFAASLDEVSADTWLAHGDAGDPSQGAAAKQKLRDQVAAWQASFSGRRFLLPAFKAAVLLMGRSQVLKGEE